MINYPIGDMLVRLKNAYLARHEQVVIPGSKMKEAVLSVLKKEGYIKDFKVDKQPPKSFITVYLRYNLDKHRRPQPAIQGLKLVSTPGRRIYISYNQIPPVFSGIGINILSTNKGILTGAQAQKAKTGGELICQIW
ncbi:MAG: 30S ribosomal protein S8 [bacterium]|nr:30S ribosomal protein S8 [bacterium]